MAAVEFNTTPYAMGFSRRYIGEQPRGRGSWAFEVRDRNGVEHIEWVEGKLYSEAKRIIAALVIAEGWQTVVRVLP